MSSESRELHQVLREVLPPACRARVCEEVQRAVFRHLDAERGMARIEPKTAPRREEPKKSSILQPKIDFKIWMEHSQVLTVFFIDVVDYTARAARVRDRESSLLQFVNTFEGAVIPLVKEYKGRVVKKLGDGILAAFIHPALAGLASLAIQQEVKDHNRFAVEEEKFFARIGLHTGTVIWKEDDIFGDVVNVASRMQHAAQPGMVLMTEATHREVSDFFVCRSLGRIKVKGVSEGVVAHVLERARPEVAEALEFLKGDGREGRFGGAAGQEGFSAAPGGAPGGTRGDGRGAGRDGKEVFTRLEESLFTPTFEIPREGPLAKDGSAVRESAAREHATREILAHFRGMLQDISKASEEFVGDYHEEYIFKAYLQSKWEEVIQKLNGKG
jgi:class 3 adenylate cyclase